MPRHRYSWLAAAMLLGALSVGAIYRHDVGRAKLRVAHERRVVDTALGRIEYGEEGVGPPVLVIHGAGGGFDQGLLLGRYLQQSRHRIIAVSRFGYLGTPTPQDASAEAQADAHAALLKALGLGRVAVVGASAGAPSALQLAIRHPELVSALLLLAPATYLPEAGGAGTRVPRGLNVLFGTVLRWDLPFWVASRLARSFLLRSVLGTPPQLLANAPAADREQVAAMLDSVLPVSQRREGLLIDARVTSHLSRYALESIRAPTLIISAQDDLYGTYDRAQYTAQAIPGARFVGYPTGGHLLVGRSASVTAETIALLNTAENTMSAASGPHRD